MIKDLRIERKAGIEPIKEIKIPVKSGTKQQFNISKILSVRNSIFFLILLQIITLFLLVKPVNLINQLNAIQVFNRVSTLAQVPPQELPVMAVIGDMKSLPTHKDLVNSNEINAQVYKDALDGDYVLGYSSKMIIYRANEDRIIYEGESPTQIQQKTQANLVNLVINKAKQSGLLPQESKEIPSTNLITDPNLVKQAYPSFYANLLKDDIVAIFNSSSLILIYRPSTDELVNYGKISTIIN